MKAIDVAHYIINNSSVNNLRLNKLMYYCQRESLKKHNKPLFDDEILAYKYGAVIPDTYYIYCGYGGLDIPNDYNTDIPKEQQDIIDYVLDKFKDTNTWDLVKLNQSGVWKEIYNGGKGERLPIPLDMIKNEVI